MKYQGSKNRHAKEILPIMLKDRKDGQWFYDLFCGGGNICDKVKDNIIANDSNRYAIGALRLIRDNIDKLPKDNTETNENQYKKIKNQKCNTKEDIETKGYFGFALSYGGKWFGGWCRDRENKRDYVGEAYRNALKQSPNLQNVIFENKSYDEVELEPHSIIYCDIPYKGTTKYNTAKFDYDKFYEWCVKKTQEGHRVFISEYNMPEDRFECVWQKKVNSSLTKNTGAKKNIEKLWVVRK
jgi:DNA adenine methylase